MHENSRPKVKLGQVGVGLNTAQNHSSKALKCYIWSLFPQVTYTFDNKSYYILLCQAGVVPNMGEQSLV